MTWIAIDCDLFDHPKMVDLPNDSARYGWLVALSKAKRQRNAGTFASAKHFTHVLGKYGKYANDYLKAGLLEKSDAGELVIHDWRKHQWAASKARLRDDDGETSSGLGVDTDETPSGQSEDSRGRSAVPVPLSVGISSGEGFGEGVGRGDPEWPAMVWLAQHKAAISEGSKLHLRLTRLVEKHGGPAVIRAMAALGDGMEANQYVLGADNALNPIPSGRRETPAESKAREIADLKAEAQRRMAASAR